MSNLSRVTVKLHRISEMSWKKISLIVLIIIFFGLIISSILPQSVTDLKLGPGAKLTVYNDAAEKYDELNGPEVDRCILLFNNWLLKNERGWEVWFDEAPPQIEFIDGNTKIKIWSNAVVVETSNQLVVKKVDARRGEEIGQILAILHQK